MDEIREMELASWEVEVMEYSQTIYEFFTNVIAMQGPLKKVASELDMSQTDISKRLSLEEGLPRFNLINLQKALDAFDLYDLLIEFLEKKSKERKQGERDAVIQRLSKLGDGKLKEVKDGLDEILKLMDARK